jgi:Ni/Co efflux regulator RcnB
MNKTLTGMVAGMAAIASALTAVPASAQRWRDSDRDGRPDRAEWNRDRDRDGRPDQFDRRDNRRQNYRWNSYGGRHGYNGYQGRWRQGQRYTYWNDRSRYINDYARYGLPAPRRGYRYYRDNSGDVVMAAIGSGIIGLILGNQLGSRW